MLFIIFLALGVGSFIAYRITNGSVNLLLVLGPAIFLANMLKTQSLPLVHWFQDKMAASKTASLETDNVVDIVEHVVKLWQPTPWQLDFYFLLPVTLIYFLLIGLHLSHLSQEKGWLRFLSILALISFLGFIHYKAWMALGTYYRPLF